MKKIAYFGSLAIILSLTACGDTTNDLHKETPSSQTNNNNNNNTINSNCGNGQLNYGEQCDGDALGGATCTNLGKGYTGGTLGCSNNCSYDESNCSAVAPANCGDGEVGKGEECDGTNLKNKTCTDFAGYSGGTLGCFDTCRFDKTKCTPIPDDDPGDNTDTPSANNTCTGPNKYSVSGVKDGYPCNFDSDCGEKDSYCASYGLQINFCAGTTLTVDKADDAYWDTTDLDIADYYPCVDDADCKSSSYCYFGDDISICLPQCLGTDRASAPFNCEKVYGHKDLTFGCTLGSGGLGKNGDSCYSAEYDCVANSICYKNKCGENCTIDSDCGAGFSCQYLTTNGKGQCFANTLIGRGETGSACISNGLCKSGLYCSNDLVCSKNPNTVVSNYPVKGLADGLPCNNHFDCASGICAAYYWDDEDNDGDIFDHICGINNMSVYEEYMLTNGVSADYTPCNYDVDCATYVNGAKDTTECWFADSDTYTNSLCVVSCFESVGDNDEVTTKDCPLGYVCDEEDYLCLPPRGTGVSGSSCKMTYWDCAKGYKCDTLTLTCQSDDEK